MHIPGCQKSGVFHSNFSFFSTIFFYQLSDSHVKAGTRFSLRDKQLFEISEVEITRVNCTCYKYDELFMLK